MFDFHCVAKTRKGRLKIYTLFLVCSQIWLNLPKDNWHFDYTQEFHIKNTVPNTSKPNLEPAQHWL